MDMKRKYAELLYQHHILMEDWGYILPLDAFRRVTGRDDDPESVMTVMNSERMPWVESGEVGWKWKDFYWRGDLELGKYLKDLGA